MGESARSLRSVSKASVQSRVSQDEWEARCDLAAACRLAGVYKWTDLIYTHYTARVPNSAHYLMNPLGLMFEEITASSLVKIDAHGNVVDDPLNLGCSPAGFIIHSSVYQARAEVQCVIHTHTRAGVAVSAQRCGLLPLSQHAMRVYGILSYHDYEGIALNLDERARLARDLGPTARTMILRNHGLLSLGSSVREAFHLMYYLDCACQIQIDALAGGRVELGSISDPTARNGFRQFEGPGGSEIDKEWSALMRLLERRGDVWAT
jgi:ribulose-5-phosphate 4-epimerase/fuculose-1-phosphate aldolase